MLVVSVFSSQLQGPQPHLFESHVRAGARYAQLVPMVSREENPFTLCCDLSAVATTHLDGVGCMGFKGPFGEDIDE